MISVLLYFCVTTGTAFAIAKRLKIAPAVLAILVLLPLTLTGAALFRGDVYGPLDLAYVSEPFASAPEAAVVASVRNPAVSDVYAQFFPWNEALRYAVRHHEWPHWNPFVLSGTPLAASVQTALFHPVTLLRGLVPIAQGITLSASLVFFLAALSAFLLAFELTDDQWASLLGAAAWMYSTLMVFFSGTALSLSVALMPLVVLAARRIVIAPGIRSGALLLAGLSLVLVGGHPESTLHVITLAIAFFLFTLITTNGVRWRAVFVTGIVAGFTALLLCAVYVVPFIEAAQQSQEFRFRQGGYSELQLSSTPQQLAHRLCANFFPFLEGAEGLEYTAHPAATRHGWIGNFYPGWLVIGLALSGVFLSRSRVRWFLAGALLFGIAIAVAAPGLVELIQLLPLFNIGVNDRMVSFAALSAAMLAALGAHEIRVNPRRAVLPLAISIAIAALGAALIATDLPPDFVRTGAARAILPIVLAIIGLLALKAERAVQLLLVLLLVQRVGEAAWMQPTVSRKAYYPPIAALDLMRTDEPSRVVGLDSMLVPNLATHYGLEDVRGFEALTLARYYDTFPLWSHAQPVWSNRVDRLDSPFLSALNVRFAMTPPQYALPHGWVERLRTPHYVVAENLRVLPRAWIPRRLMFAEGVGTIAGMGDTLDFSEEGWLERRPAGDGGMNGSGVVRATRNGTGLRLRATIQTAAWMFVSNAAWSGWHARENGVEIPLRVANYTMLALHLPPGDHDIELSYRPRSFVPAAAVSACTLLMLLGVALTLRYRART